jgi:hypothetical protein
LSGAAADAWPPIIDEVLLARFRRDELSAERLYRAIGGHRVTLINSPVGSGKSVALDNIVDYVRTRSECDGILVVVELKVSLNERRLVREPTSDTMVLRPRPSESCGPARDADWRRHERNGTTAWAKANICAKCEHFQGCHFPTQYGSQLQSKRLVFGTHQHIINNSRFPYHVATMARWRNALLIVDEARMLLSSYRRAMSRQDISTFIRAIERTNLKSEAKEAWLLPLRTLTRAGTEDLRTDDWFFPYPSPELAVPIQDAGLSLDRNFRWLGYDLHAFMKARPDERWRDANGNVVFVVTPYLSQHTLILSAGMPKSYVQRQLHCDDVVAPLERFRIKHRDTRLYNLCSLLAAASRFVGNHEQILDFFAQLIMRNVAAGKRTLLVSRKRSKSLCKNYLEQRLAKWGYQVSIVESNGEPVADTSPSCIPLIHYGICGINTFEGYDAAYCLNSYYIDNQVLQEAVADVEYDGLTFPVEVRVVGNPRCRVAATFQDQFQGTTADSTIADYLYQLETNVVIQAAGRVRYATRPREVIFFQCSDLRGVNLDGEFYNLSAARDQFGVLTGSDYDRREQEQLCARLRDQHLTTVQIAAALNVSERTVRNRLRSWRRRRAQ